MRYKLSAAADSDLERHYDWGIERFGQAAADSYFDGISKRFDDIAEAPLQWPTVDHILSGYRRSVYRRNTIYYIIEADCVLLREIDSSDRFLFLKAHFVVEDCCFNAVLHMFTSGGGKMVDIRNTAYGCATRKSSIAIRN